MVFVALTGCGLKNFGKNINYERRQAYVKIHTELEDQTRIDITNGSIRRGMNKSEVRASWGKPDDIHTSVGSWGKTEQWIYDTVKWYGQGYQMSVPDKYLYFKNGKLEGWSD